MVISTNVCVPTTSCTFPMFAVLSFPALLLILGVGTCLNVGQLKIFLIAHVHDLDALVVRVDPLILLRYVSLLKHSRELTKTSLELDVLIVHPFKMQAKFGHKVLQLRV